MRIRLKHHYGLSHHDFDDGIDHQLGAYFAVRSSHDFLTDDNHNFRVLASSITHAGELIKFDQIQIYKNSNTESIVYDGRIGSLQTQYDFLYTDNEWFSCEYFYNKEKFTNDKRRYYSYKRKAIPHLTVAYA